MLKFHITCEFVTSFFIFIFTKNALNRRRNAMFLPLRDYYIFSLLTISLSTVCATTDSLGGVGIPHNFDQLELDALQCCVRNFLSRCFHRILLMYSRSDAR